ncbi:MAG: chorismate mutase, partial [Erysipelotrichaceae bacterium]|nr:chorismate mutase [Erysipelotrichaceae bacterium]
MAVFFDYLGLVLYNIIGNNYMEDLKQLRQQINDIDQEMVKLFERRMKVSSKIAQFKRENNLPIYDKKREEQVLKRNCSLLEDASLNDYYRIFQNQLMDLSKQYQNEINCERNTINIILDKCGYNITIDDNLVNDINKVFYLKRKVLFIYDDNLSEEVVEKVSSQIDKCYPLQLHASEKQKNFETLTVIYDTLIQNCFNRNDCILCLSGGLISDI